MVVRGVVKLIIFIERPVVFVELAVVVVVVLKRWGGAAEVVEVAFFSNNPNSGLWKL